MHARMHTGAPYILTVSYAHHALRSSPRRVLFIRDVSPILRQTEDPSFSLPQALQPLASSPFYLPAFPHFGIEDITMILGPRRNEQELRWNAARALSRAWKISIDRLNVGLFSRTAALSLSLLCSALESNA